MWSIRSHDGLIGPKTSAWLLNAEKNPIIYPNGEYSLALDAQFYRRWMWRNSRIPNAIQIKSIVGG
jgi:hypothetical protein